MAEKKTFSQRFRETSPVYQREQEELEKRRQIQADILKSLIQNQPELFNTKNLSQILSDVVEGRTFSLDSISNNPVTAGVDGTIQAQPTIEPQKLSPKKTTGISLFPQTVTEEVSRLTGGALEVDSVVPQYIVNQAIQAQKVKEQQIGQTQREGMRQSAGIQKESQRQGAQTERLKESERRKTLNKLVTEVAKEDQEKAAKIIKDYETSGALPNPEEFRTMGEKVRDVAIEFFFGSKKGATAEGKKSATSLSSKEKEELSDYLSRMDNRTKKVVEGWGLGEKELLLRIRKELGQ